MLKNLTNYAIPSDRFVFFFERKFFNASFQDERRLWIKENWHFSLVIALIYITLVHVGQYVMRNRDKLHLYRSLIAWNLVMAGFSILGAVRFVPYFMYLVNTKGIVYSVCVLEKETNEYVLYGVPICWAVV